jgi:hypothetical protein
MITKSKLVKFALNTKKFSIPKTDESRLSPSPPVLKAGKVFEKKIRELYPDGIDLSNYGKSIQQKGQKSLEVILNSPNYIFYNVTLCTPDGKISFEADIVVRGATGKLKIIEVKNSPAIYPNHIIDVALQMLVISKLGLAKRVRFYLAKPNLEYTSADSSIDLVDYVEEIDITARVKAAQPIITELLYLMNRDGFPKDAIEKEIQSVTKKIESSDFKYVPELLQIFENGSSDYNAMEFINHDYSESNASRLFEINNIEVKQLYRQFGYHEKLHFINFSTIEPSWPLYPRTKPFDTIPINSTIITLDLRKNKVIRKIITADAGTDSRTIIRESLKSFFSEDKEPIIYFGEIAKELLESILSLEFQKNMFDCMNLFYDSKSKNKIKRHPLLRYVSKFFINELDGLPNHYNYNKHDNLVWTDLKNLDKVDAFREKELIELSSFIDCFRLFAMFTRIKNKIYLQKFKSPKNSFEEGGDLSKK